MLPERNAQRGEYGAGVELKTNEVRLALGIISTPAAKLPPFTGLFYSRPKWIPAAKILYIMTLYDASASRRRAARRDWRVARIALSTSTEPGEGLSPEIALGMMWQLALDAWAMTGRALPDYPRAKIPVQRLPPHEAQRD